MGTFKLVGSWRPSPASNAQALTRGPMPMKQLRITATAQQRSMGQAALQAVPSQGTPRRPGTNPNRRVETCVLWLPVRAQALGFDSPARIGSPRGRQCVAVNNSNNINNNMLVF